MSIDRIVSAWESGQYTWSQVGDLFGISADAARSRYNRWKRRQGREGDSFLGVDKNLLIRALKAKPCTLTELSALFDRSEETIEKVLDRMVELGYGLIQEEEIVTLPQSPSVDYSPQSIFKEGKTEDICFGVVSDLHAGSKAEQLTALGDFVHVAIEEYGVKHILNPGDSFAGVNVYKGQQNDVYALTGEEQAEVIANNRPEGVTWYDLGGNHDYSFYKQSGIDVRQLLSAKGRNDIVLLNYDVQDISLLPGIEARLWHPIGGPAYAISYKGQKYVEQLAFNELMSVVAGDKPKPTIRFVFVGHFHKKFIFRQGPIWVIGCGCFEGQNTLTRRKGWEPHIGGTIIKCRIVDGFVHRLEAIPIDYPEVEDDWKSYYSPKAKTVKTFTLI